MAYTKHIWVNDSEPDLDADNLNEMEQGIYDANNGLESKQDTLVSGTNIKTINGVSLLSGGDMEVGASIPIQDTAPSNPLEDDLWIDTSASGGGTNILDAIYPIGSVVIRDSSVDLSNWLGFTWQKTFAGRVLVGLDTSQTEFNTIGKTGGSKYLQRHNHILASQGSGTSEYVMAVTQQGTNKTMSTEYSGTGDSGNLQPYQVVAYWKRTA